MTSAVDKFQKLLSGEPIPNIPDWNSGWDLSAYHLEQERFQRRLLEYIRRLFSKITDANIISVLGDVGIADWQYNAVAHKFQVKRFLDTGLVGDWENAPGDQPVKLNYVLDDVAYDDGTGVLSEDRTADVYVLNFGSGTTPTITTFEPCPEGS